MHLSVLKYVRYDEKKGQFTKKSTSLLLSLFLILSYFKCNCNYNPTLPPPRLDNFGIFPKQHLAALASLGGHHLYMTLCVCVCVRVSVPIFWKILCILFVRLFVPPPCSCVCSSPLVRYPSARRRRNHCMVELGGVGVPTYRNRVVIFFIWQRPLKPYLPLSHFDVSFSKYLIKR